MGGIVKYDRIAALSIVLCAALVFGQLVTYVIDPFEYEADAEWTSDGVTYSLSASVTDTYSVILLDNGKLVAPDTLYIYSDERYEQTFEAANKTTDIQYQDPDHSATQMIRSLNVRGFDNIYTVGNEGLKTVVDGAPEGKALLIMSSVLPKSVYDGTDGSPLIRWIEDGGSLYWTGSEIGRFYATVENVVEVTANQMLFFGAECVNTGDVDVALMMVESEGLTEALALKWNRVKYGVDPSKVPGSFSAGYSQEGYSSVTFSPKGDGMICVIGGESTNRLKYDDVAQVISSGVTCTTTVLDIEYGSISIESKKGEMRLYGSETNPRLVIYLGGYYTIFAESFDKKDVEG